MACASPRRHQIMSPHVNRPGDVNSHTPTRFPMMDAQIMHGQQRAEGRTFPSWPTAMPFTSLLPKHRQCRDDGLVMKRTALIFGCSLAFAACSLGVANSLSTAVGDGRVTKNLHVTVLDNVNGTPLSDIEVIFRGDRDDLSTQVTDAQGQALLQIELPSNTVSDLFRRDSHYGVMGNLELRNATGPLMSVPLGELVPKGRRSLETPLPPLTLVTSGR
jgi:hypothetical protein